MNPFLNQPLPSTRITFFLAFAACTAMMMVALIMQYVFVMEPCPLCITQRVFVILAGITALIAGLHHPQKLGTRIYAVVGALFCIVGGGVSSRHVWLQSLPEDQVPTCGPGLSYMFDALPFQDAVALLFAGDGNCAETGWTFLGLTIPAWTLVCFIGLTCIFIWQFVRKN